MNDGVEVGSVVAECSVAGAVGDGVDTEFGGQVFAGVLSADAEGTGDGALGEPLLVEDDNAVDQVGAGQPIEGMFHEARS